MTLVRARLFRLPDWTVEPAGDETEGLAETPADLGVRRSAGYGSSLPTRVLMVLPSARPATFVCTAFITAPICFLSVAPSS